MNMKLKKRGAIELSMTTIIVIVIGVTLLILGLTWVRGMFEKIGSITDAQLDAAKVEISQKMQASDKFYISGTSINAEPGKTRTINIGVQNIGEQDTSAKFKFSVEVGEGADAKWFTLPLPIDIAVGEIKSNVINVVVPKGTPTGQSYPVNVIVYKDDKVYDSEAIMLNVANST